MDPITIGMILGGVGGFDELTTGYDRQQRDAKNKASIYRLMAYDRRLNPDSQDIYEPNVFGKAAQGFMGGYQLGSNINTQQAAQRALNSYAGQGGFTEAQLNSMDAGSQAPEDFVPPPSSGPRLLGGGNSDLFLSRSKGQPDQIYRAQHASWNPYRAMRGYS